MFIILEGPDHVGKTTQLARLVKSLTDMGKDVVATREPGGTPFAEEVRNVLLHGSKTDPVSELLLFNAARRDHVLNCIVPALNAGKIVVCDRFLPSTLAYQTFKGLSYSEVLQAHRSYVTPVMSYHRMIMLVLTASLETRMNRAARKTESGVDNFENRPSEFQVHTNKVYREILDGDFILGGVVTEIVTDDQDEDQVASSILNSLNL